MEVGPDRRGACRYPAQGVPVLIAWPQAAERPSPAATQPSWNRAWGPRAASQSPGAGCEVSSGCTPEEVGPCPDGLTHRSGRLLDLSQTGLCVHLDQLPPDGQRLWLAYRDSGAPSWVQVVPQSVSEVPSGGFLLRLSFAYGCPYGLFSETVLRPGIRKAGGRGESPVAG
jgi:hypothetical protein